MAQSPTEADNEWLCNSLWKLKLFHSSTFVIAFVTSKQLCFGSINNEISLLHVHSGARCLPLWHFCVLCLPWQFYCAQSEKWLQAGASQSHTANPNCVTEVPIGFFSSKSRVIDGQNVSKVPVFWTLKGTQYYAGAGLEIQKARMLCHLNIPVLAQPFVGSYPAFCWCLVTKTLLL